MLSTFYLLFKYITKITEQLLQVFLDFPNRTLLNRVERMLLPLEIQKLLKTTISQGVEYRRPVKEVCMIMFSEDRVKHSELRHLKACRPWIQGETWVCVLPLDSS